MALGRDDERKIGAESLCAERGTIAEADFAEYDGESEALLGVIVGGFHAVDVKKSEDAVCIAVSINKPLSEIFGIWVAQMRVADGVDSSLKLRFARLGFGE